MSVARLQSKSFMSQFSVNDMNIEPQGDEVSGAIFISNKRALSPEEPDESYVITCVGTDVGGMKDNLVIGSKTGGGASVTIDPFGTTTFVSGDVIVEEGNLYVHGQPVNPAMKFQLVKDPGTYPVEMPMISSSTKAHWMDGKLGWRRDGKPLRLTPGKHYFLNAYFVCRSGCDNTGFFLTFNDDTTSNRFLIADVAKGQVKEVPISFMFTAPSDATQLGAFIQSDSTPASANILHATKYFGLTQLD